MESRFLLVVTEDFLHHFDQSQCALIVNPVEYLIGFFVEGQQAFVTQYRQMLGDVALGGSYLFYDFLDTGGTFPKTAQNFQPDRVGHRLKATRRLYNIFIIGNEHTDEPFGFIVLTK